MTALRISPADARARLQAQPPALLICAYDDEATCASIKIPGSITMRELQKRLPSLPRSQELVFY